MTIFALGRFGSVLHFQANIFEILRVPERLEVAAQALFVVGIARAREDARLQRLAADAAVALELNALDDRLASGPARCCAPRQGLRRLRRMQARGGQHSRREQHTHCSAVL